MTKQYIYSHIDEFAKKEKIEGSSLTDDVFCSLDGNHAHR